MPDKPFSLEQLDPYLNSLLALDANTVMLTLYNTLVSWVHRTYQNVDEYQTAYDQFIRQTHLVIHRETFRQRDKVQLFEYRGAKQPEQIASELSALLDQLPRENGLEFLSELLGAWCLTCPKEKARKYYKNENISDIELAETLFWWSLRPFDFFG